MPVCGSFLPPLFTSTASQDRFCTVHCFPQSTFLHRFSFPRFLVLHFHTDGWSWTHGPPPDFSPGHSLRAPLRSLFCCARRADRQVMLPHSTSAHCHRNLRLYHLLRFARAPLRACAPRVYLYYPRALALRALLHMVAGSRASVRATTRNSCAHSAGISPLLHLRALAILPLSHAHAALHSHLHFIGSTGLHWMHTLTLLPLLPRGSAVRCTGPPHGSLPSRLVYLLAHHSSPGLHTLRTFSATLSSFALHLLCALTALYLRLHLHATALHHLFPLDSRFTSWFFTRTSALTCTHCCLDSPSAARMHQFWLSRTLDHTAPAVLPLG